MSTPCTPMFRSTSSPTYLAEASRSWAAMVVSSAGERRGGRGLQTRDLLFSLYLCITGSETDTCKYRGTCAYTYISQERVHMQTQVYVHCTCTYRYMYMCMYMHLYRDTRTCIRHMYKYYFKNCCSRFISSCHDNPPDFLDDWMDSTMNLPPAWITTMPLRQ